MLVSATALLRDKSPGSFLVRDSQSFEGGFGLAVKVEIPPSNVLQQVNGDICKLKKNTFIYSKGKDIFQTPCFTQYKFETTTYFFNEKITSTFQTIMTIIYV